MPGVLTWRQTGRQRKRACSLCGWVSPVASEETAAPLDRRRVLQEIKAAFKAHNCKDYPRNPSSVVSEETEPEPEPDPDEPLWSASPPLDRTVLGTDSGYWLVRVVSAERTGPGDLLLSLTIERDVDGEETETLSLRIEIPLSEMSGPLWQSQLSTQVRMWIGQGSREGFLKIDRLSQTHSGKEAKGEAGRPN